MPVYTERIQRYIDLIKRDGYTVEQLNDRFIITLDGDLPFTVLAVDGAMADRNIRLFMRGLPQIDNAESMPNLVPSDAYPDLLNVINEGWDEPIDRIELAQFDSNGNIFALAYSGDIPLAVKIDDDSVEVRPIGDTTAQFAARKPDIPAQIADNLQGKGDPIVSNWLRQIEQMLATSDDLETAREALFQLYPDLDRAC